MQCEIDQSGKVEQLNTDEEHTGKENIIKETLKKLIAKHTYSKYGNKQACF